MYNSKCFKILVTFDDSDWRGCKQFLQSKYRKSTDICRLYNYIHRHRQNLVSKRLQLDLTREKLFPATSRKSFLNIMSKLSGAIDLFLIWQDITHDPVGRDIRLLSVYKRRGLFRLFDLKAEALKKSRLQKGEIDLFSDLNYLKIEHSQFFSDHTPRVRQRRDNLDNAIVRLGAFAKKMSLYYLFAQMRMSDIWNVEPTERRNILQYLSNLEYEDEAVLFLNHIILLTTNANKESYQFLFELIESDNRSLSVELNSVAVLLMIRYISNQLKRGNEEKAAELLFLYDYGLEHGALLVNNQIPGARFLNYVNIAGVCKAFEKAEEFIDTHKGLLDGKHRSSVVRIAHAQLSFNMGDYSETLFLIQRIKSSVPYVFASRIRWLFLCSHFMESRDDRIFLDSIFKNYSSFFYNNKKKISISNFEASLNLAKILRLILSSDSIEKVERVLNNTDRVIFKIWLSNQLAKEKGQI